jgi:hypothetical protein
MESKIKALIVEAEENLRLAMLNSNVEALDKLLSPELFFTNHLGMVSGKKDDLDFHRSGMFKLKSLTPSEQRIQIRDGFAIVSVLMHLAGSLANNPFDSKIRYTRVWDTSSGKQFQVIAGHSSTLN